MKVYPDIKLPEPRVSHWLIPFLRPLSKIYLFFMYGTAKIVLQGDTVLFDVFNRALAGQSRCITAFRHSNGGEPQLLSWFFLFRLKALAAKKGIRFARRPHAVFIYGYEVARWGGWIARLVMPQLGAMPVHHAKMDNKSMDRIYNAIIDGPYPIALAPEGQVSYTTDAVPRLESGVIRIGFRAAQKVKEKSGCPVEILPVSFHFRYSASGKLGMESLLRKIEKITGLPDKSVEKLTFTERLERCRNYILELNETRYQIKHDSSLSFDERLDRVINSALETAERMLGLKSEGELYSRMYRLRQICWDRIVLPGTDSLDKMSRARRGMLDLRAGEAWYIGRHQEIVDFSSYFHSQLPGKDTDLHNKIEYVQNLWDFANRSMGGAIADRINIAPQKIIIRFAPPVNISGRLQQYYEDKKTAIAQAMSDLEKAYLDNIREVNNQEQKIT
jgi:1-acyl-sn-glycerol-3-phosphate acyltransferase